MCDSMRQNLQPRGTKSALATHRPAFVHILAPLAPQQVNDIPNIKVGYPVYHKVYR